MTALVFAIAATITATAFAARGDQQLVSRIDSALSQTFGDRAPVFRCIAQRESHYRDDPAAALSAVSPTHDHGLLQIHVFPGERGRAGVSIAQLHTLAGNLLAASRLSAGGRDLSPWRGGAYRCW